jgi:hypothetical protein
MAAAAANRGIASGSFVQDMLGGLTYPASSDALPNHNVAAAAAHQPLQLPGAMSSSQALVTVGSSCTFLGNHYGGPVGMLASGAAAAEGSPTYSSGSSSIVISSPQLHAAYGFA